MQPDGFSDLIAYSKDGIERCHRVLKDHGDLVASDLAHLLLGQFEQIPAFKDDLAFDDLAGMGDQAHDGHGRDAFARAGFTDDAQRLALVHGQIDAVNGFDRIGAEP